MKRLKVITFITLILVGYLSHAQKMTNDDLEKIFYVVSDSLRGEPGNWQFMLKGRIMICISDESNNRMRIMSPIIAQNKLEYPDMLKLMEANFHTALDVKYAISEHLLWAVYIHPLEELQQNEVISAIQQVFTAAETYGSTYSSTGLVFPDKKEEELKKSKKKS